MGRPKCTRILPRSSAHGKKVSPRPLDPNQVAGSADRVGGRLRVFAIADRHEAFADPTAGCRAIKKSGRRLACFLLGASRIEAGIPDTAGSPKCLGLSVGGTRWGVLDPEWGVSEVAGRSVRPRSPAARNDGTTLGARGGPTGPAGPVAGRLRGVYSTRGSPSGWEGAAAREGP
jgi:hypothetical protein